MQPSQTIAEKFILSSDIDAPCADIAYSWTTGTHAELRIRMRFTQVREGFGKDVELIFRRPAAVQWEDEGFSLIETPRDIPKCSGPKFSYWVYPTLLIKGSAWSKLYSDRLPSKDPSARVTHYAFISMNDLLFVLSEEQPEVRFLDAD
jgi:hypothetical protein